MRGDNQVDIRVAQVDIRVAQVDIRVAQVDIRVAQEIALLLGKCK